MLRKIISTALIGLCSFVGVSSGAANSTQPAKEDNQTENPDMKTEGKKLAAFFSHTGENYNVDHIEKDNTHIIADI